MKHIQSFDDFLNEANKEITSEKTAQEIFESVYPEKNGQLSAYDKKNFTEVGRHTMYLGKDLACILLFGYSHMSWKGREEWNTYVTCTSYATDVRNLGNSNGSIISSETFGTEEDAKMAATNLLKSLKMK
jgi:hypothetical protein